MARLTKRTFKKLTPADIAKMKAPELRELLRGARILFTQQESKFSKYQDKVWSPALDKMQEYYRNNGTEHVRTRGGIEEYYTSPKATSKMGVNEMRSELFHLQDFFEAKTSTVPGARKVQKETASRIFGTDKNGRPRATLDTDQWAQFWSLYEEYKNMRPADVYEQSTVVQQAVGQVIIEAMKNNADTWFSMGSLREIEDLVSQKSESLNMENSVDYGSDTVFSGTRVD